MIDTLKNEGHDIIAVKNGNEMLHVIDTHPEIDLVLLELLLPDYSGYELCKMIRAEKNLVELPILILTAAINPEDLQYAFSIGANDFIHKPYPLNELKARVSSLLHMKSATTRSDMYEIAFLRAQIKPHFLYNALNTIAELCIISPNKASDLIVSLSKYLRGTLDFSNLGSVVSAEKEIALVRAYLDIEKVRFPELYVDFIIDKNIDVQLPPLTLQVLVENAVKHGAICREGGGNIRIIIKESGEGVLFSVENNGFELSNEEVLGYLNTPQVESSIGIYNVNVRLMKMYGSGLGFTHGDNFDVKVSFLIPTGGFFNA